jgi:hypothetical protein
MAAFFRLDGQDDFRRAMRELGRRGRASARAALYREAEAIMTVSKTLVPVDLGALRNTGTVFPPEVRGATIVVEMGYGGPAVTYAIAVHETPSKYDPPSWRGKSVHFTVGGPKYLEKPTLEAIPGMDARLAADMRRDLEAPYR